MKHLPVDSSCFHGKSYFEDDGIKNYLVFQPIYKYFKMVANTNTCQVTSWKSKGMFDESIKSLSTSDKS